MGCKTAEKGRMRQSEAWEFIENGHAITPDRCDENHESRILGHIRRTHTMIGPVPGSRNKCPEYELIPPCECDVCEYYRSTDTAGEFHYAYNYGCKCNYCKLMKDVTVRAKRRARYAGKNRHSKAKDLKAEIKAIIAQRPHKRRTNKQIKDMEYHRKHLMHRREQARERARRKRVENRDKVNASHIRYRKANQEIYNLRRRLRYALTGV